MISVNSGSSPKQGTSEFLAEFGGQTLADP